MIIVPGHESLAIGSRSSTFRDRVALILDEKGTSCCENKADGYDKPRYKRQAVHIYEARIRIQELIEPLGLRYLFGKSRPFYDIIVNSSLSVRSVPSVVGRSEIDSENHTTHKLETRKTQK